MSACLFRFRPVGLGDDPRLQPSLTAAMYCVEAGACSVATSGRMVGESDAPSITGLLTAPPWPCSRCLASARTSSSRLWGSVSGPAGLLQITEIVRKDWNVAHPDAPVSRADLFDPETNVRIGSALLNRIVQVYRHHRTLKPDWASRRYAELVALGWNAGYSDRGGVALAVTELEAAGARPDDVTVDSVARVAAVLPQASRFVSLPDRIAYAKAVADLYLGSRRAPVVAGRGSAVGPVVVAVLGAYGLVHFGRRGTA